jgi:TM2 domain-containing membrane protein YozV
MNTNMMEYDARKKSMLLAYLAWAFLGGLGVHRFYLNRTGSGVAQLLLTVFGWFTLPLGIGMFLLGGLAIWLFVDLFLVAGMVSEYNLALARSLQPAPRPAATAALMQPPKQTPPDLHKWAD